MRILQAFGCRGHYGFEDYEYYEPLPVYKACESQTWKKHG